MMQTPDAITPALLDVVVMPNGEVICLGKTVGWTQTHGKHLTPNVLADARNTLAVVDRLFARIRREGFSAAMEHADIEVEVRTLLARLEGEQP
jgi:hypothetical protein